MGKTPLHIDMPNQDGTGHPPSVYDILSEMNGKLDTITERLGKGDTALALLQHRVDNLEKIVHGVIGVILLAFIGAIVALVVK